MIKKELDSFAAQDKYSAAGRKAEEQMAFYLKRFFGSVPDIFVLNGIRIEYDGDAAQMDHLVLHRYGIIVVESKSVAAKVEIKDDGQWIRWYDKESKGMASPVIQAKLQLRFMRDYLNLAVTPKGVFDRYVFDVQVAISDSGVILWPNTGSLHEVCKADQVAERIENRIAELAKQPDALIPMKVEALSKIADFLNAAHKPFRFRVEENLSQHYQQAAADRVVDVQKQVVALQAITTQAGSRMFSVSSTTTRTAPQKADERSPEFEPFATVSVSNSAIPAHKRLLGSPCKHCLSEDVAIYYKHNYFYHCNACNKNSPLKSLCSVCGAAETAHKKGKEFFLECKACNSNRLFHVNA